MNRENAGVIAATLSFYNCFKLSLSDHYKLHLQKEGGTLICDALTKSNVKHLTLNLKEIKAVDCFIRKIGQTKITFLKFDNAGVRLPYSLCKLIGDSLKVSLLKELSITNVSTDGLLYMADKIPESSISALKFERCDQPFGDGNFVTFCHLISKTKLKSLSLCYCALSDKDAGILANHIKSWSVADLDLSHNKINCSGATFLTTACMNSSVKTLKLYGQESDLPHGFI